MKKTNSKKSKYTDEKVQESFSVDLETCCQKYNTSAPICLTLNANVRPEFPMSIYPCGLIEAISFIIYIANENFQKTGNLDKIYIRHQKIPENFFEALGEALQKYDSLTSINVEFCGLTTKNVECLTLILMEFYNITELVINGNPTEFQIYDNLINDTNLKYLSLQKCKIQKDEIILICNSLMNNKRLIYLNLAGNNIDDEMVEHIVKMLRQNRKLQMLILADNWITDLGCKKIMRALQNFILTPEEIIVKRKFTFEYLQKNKGEVNGKNGENGSVLESLISSVQRITNSSSRVLNKGANISNSSVNIKKFYHPFLTECYDNGGEIICVGNGKLAYLNLAYNKIGIDGYREILSLLRHQYQYEKVGTGLTYIILEGNLETSSEDYSDIYKFITERILKLGSHSKGLVLTGNSASKVN